MRTCFLLLLILVVPLAAQTNLVETLSEYNVTEEVGWEAESIDLADVNGDTYADLIVGAPTTNVYHGSVLIFYGGPAMDDEADLTLNGENEGDAFGNTVANAGDLNNDGYDDLLVAASCYNNYQGRIYVYFGGEPMDTTPDLVLDGSLENDDFGWDLAGIGDINGDNYDDFAISDDEYGLDDQYDDYYYGQVQVFLGGSTLSTTPILTITGENDTDELGSCIAGAGDVNNDGYDDFMLGSSEMYDGYGEVQIFYGGETISSTPDKSLYGDEQGSGFAGSLFGNVDVNHDNYDDIIVGCYNDDSNTGCVNIYYGGTSIGDNPDVVLAGEVTNDRFGYVICGGDLDNDNYDDIIVYAMGPDLYGKVYVFKGGSSMDSSHDLFIQGSAGDELIYALACGDINNDDYDDFVIPSWANEGSTCYILHGGSTLDANIDLTIQAEPEQSPGSGNDFGYSAAMAGDVNNDGYNDIIIGATGYDGNSGCAYIYFGGPGFDNTPDVLLTRYQNNSKFGYCVAGVGDVNNDNYDDVLVSAPFASDGGKAYLYLGGASMDNTPDLQIDNPASSGRFGESLSALGDFNNDNYDDFVIGEQQYQAFKGNAYIYYGSATPDNTEDVHLTGSDYNTGFGCSVSGGDDFNNDGYPDLLVGARLTNNWGSAYLYYGGPSFDTVADVTFSQSIQNYAYFGGRLKMVGDVNNDGFDDIIICTDPSNPYPNYAFLYFGNNSAENTADLEFVYENDGQDVVPGKAGDLNGDGINDLLVSAFYEYSDSVYIYLGGENMDNRYDMVMSNGASYEEFGKAIAGVGDVNNDGINDFLIGAPWQGMNGNAYLYNLTDDLASIGVRVYLQGPYSFDGEPYMDSALGDDIPTTSPYADHLALTSLPEDVYPIDWVWMELRSTQDGAADFSRSYLMNWDGYLLDGQSSFLDLSTQVTPGDYYIVIKHRNHLGVVSANPVTIGSAWQLYDFTTASEKVKDGNCVELTTGFYGMYGGDCGCDGIITNADKDPINSSMDATGYQNGDINMDGIVTNADKDFINTNMDKTSSVNN